eukprot:gene15371-21455_t
MQPDDSRRRRLPPQMLAPERSKGQKLIGNFFKPATSADLQNGLPLKQGRLKASLLSGVGILPPYLQHRSSLPPSLRATPLVPPYLQQGRFPPPSLFGAVPDVGIVPPTRERLLFVLAEAKVLFNNATKVAETLSQIHKKRPGRPQILPPEVYKAVQDYILARRRSGVPPKNQPRLPAPYVLGARHATRMRLSWHAHGSGPSVSSMQALPSAWTDSLTRLFKPSEKKSHEWQYDPVSYGRKLYPDGRGHSVKCRFCGKLFPYGKRFGSNKDPAIEYDRTMLCIPDEIACREDARREALMAAWLEAAIEAEGAARELPPLPSMKEVEEAARKEAEERKEAQKRTFRGRVSRFFQSLEG